MTTNELFRQIDQMFTNLENINGGRDVLRSDVRAIIVNFEQAVLADLEREADAISQLVPHPPHHFIEAPIPAWIEDEEARIEADERR